MFAKLRQRWQDTRTIMKLSLDAEKRALQEGQRHPGAEHYLLAALDLPDGSARRVFARLGVDPEAYRAALANRHAAALNTIGLHHVAPAPTSNTAGDARAPAGPADAAAAARADDAVPPAEASILFDAQPSGQALMQSLPELQRRLSAPLCGAHVLLAAAAMAHSAAGRAFKAIGIDLQALGSAAETELRSGMPF
ncbi:Clp amino terminal domain-containing protein, pathogenicity island component [Duganella sp. CF402]|uniref:Clp protease N-terminal domain-containing protein n=1 Tax=unclassified Duganella TaxID=2636909 RepID=UPI0008AB39A7|nr:MULTISPECIES: Clp protease N-terminal domain-containing protein [unclassified Duganella]RZT10565.1 ClpA/ClpB-like protein [Duganella sp. BK701]SEL08053.1 Clp amino terminal domain-containing protein, pathogenicity island component [Duganella sp. CF402]